MGVDHVLFGQSYDSSKEGSFVVRCRGDLCVCARKKGKCYQNMKIVYNIH